MSQGLQYLACQKNPAAEAHHRGKSQRGTNRYLQVRAPYQDNTIAQMPEASFPPVLKAEGLQPEAPQLQVRGTVRRKIKPQVLHIPPWYKYRRTPRYKTGNWYFYRWSGTPFQDRAVFQA